MNPNVVYAPKPSKGSFKKKAKDLSVKSYLWQAECAKQLRGVRFANVSAPCGAGKTIALTLLAAQEYVDSGRKQKQLIVAPQRVIGDAFTDTRTVTVDGTPLTWAPSLNDFVNYKQQRILRALHRWLLDPPSALLTTATDKSKLDETVAITSHQALAIVWRKMSKAKRAEALKNLSITVDEAHHITGVFDETDEQPLTKDEQAEANHLGQVIQAAVHADKSTHVRLATATFYRGDAQPILDKRLAEQFSKGTYILSWEKHWEQNLAPLESFRIDYRFYDLSPVSAALGQMAQSDQVTMIFVPPINLAWRKNNSSRLKALFAESRRLYGDDAVLDLVTQGKTQDQNVKRLRADVASLKAGNKPALRCIISCGIGLEGMDYPPVTRLINLAVQNSIVRAIQVMGRPMRQFTGKKTVEITNYVRTPCKVSDGCSIADAVADRTNSLLVCLAWDDCTHPVIIHLISLSAKGKKAKTKSTLSEALGSQYASVLEKCLVAVEYLLGNKHQATNEAVAHEVTVVLEKAKIKVTKGLVDALVVAVRRAQLKASSNPKAQKLSNFFDVRMLRTKLGYNIIEKYSLNNQTLFFGDCTRAELAKTRKVIYELTKMDDFTFKALWLKYHGGVE